MFSPLMGGSQRINTVDEEPLLTPDKPQFLWLGSAAIEMASEEEVD